MMVQSSCKVGATDYAALAMATSDKMFLSRGVLIELIGIIRMIESLLTAPPWVVTRTASGIGPVDITKTTIWLTLQTLLNHKCWRDYRRLANHLPGNLLGGTLQGVWLQCTDFDVPQRHPPPVASFKATDVVAGRRARFQSTLAALERLLAWTWAERASFTARFFGGTQHSRQFYAAAVKKKQTHRHACHRQQP